MEIPSCEICGKPATVAMTDIEECYDHKTGVFHPRPFGEPHYFCDAHDRESRIYQGPPINWPYDVPNARVGNIEEVKHKNKGIWIVLDEEGFPIYCAGWPEACHEHINEAINDFQIEDAGKWKVRRAELVPNV